MRVDFATGRADTVARVGDGPLEYRSGLAFARAPGDSAWLFDLMRRRMLVFAPDGTPRRGFPVTDSEERLASMNAPWLRAVAADGSWVGQVRGVSLDLRARESRFADSVAVVRISADGTRQDTIAMLAAPAIGGPSPGADRVMSDFDRTDAWGAFTDSTVLVVRGEGLRVERIAPDGSRRSAGAIAHRPVPLTADAVVHVQDSTNRILGGLLAATVANLPLRDGVRPRAPRYVPPDPIPATWPPLVGDAILVDTRDRAWVPVRTSAFDSAGVRYEVLDRDGRALDAFLLPAGYTLVAFGRESVYLGRRDADDLLWLERRPLP